MPKLSSIIKNIYFSEQSNFRYNYFYLLYNCIFRLCHRVSKSYFLLLFFILNSGCVSKQIFSAKPIHQNPVDNNISYPLVSSNSQQGTIPTSNILLPQTSDNYSFSTFTLIVLAVLLFCFFPYVLVFFRYVFLKIKSLTKKPD